MKPLTTPLAAILAAAVLGQAYHDLAGNVTLAAKEWLYTRATNGPTKLSLRGHVLVTSKAHSVSLSADRVTVSLVSQRGAKHGDEVKSAAADGGVDLTQTIASARQKRSVLRCSTANYTARGSDALVDFKGGVRIESFDGKLQTLLATGSSGDAVIDPKAKGGNGLRRGTLHGPVSVTIVDSMSPNSTIVAKGDHLDMDFTSGAPTLTLTGHVTIQGQGKSGFGTAQGIGRAVLLLDSKGAFKSLKTGGT